VTASPPVPLPRGRHKLSRNAVLTSQRERIVAAMLECVAAQGYAATTVSDVVSTARVSRNAFYELFPDKESCFLACCDELLQVLLDELYAEAVPQVTWRSALERGMVRYLRSWQERPEFAAAYLTELHFAGQRAIEQRERAYVRFREIFDLLAARARVEEPDLPAAPPLASRLIVIGITEVVAEEVRAGRLSRLHEMHDDLLGFATLMLAGA
jgi:AcrR family transcriptional regulator